MKRKSFKVRIEVIVESESLDINEGELHTLINSELDIFNPVVSFEIERNRDNYPTECLLTEEELYKEGIKTINYELVRIEQVED